MRREAPDMRRNVWRPGEKRDPLPDCGGATPNQCDVATQTWQQGTGTVGDNLCDWQQGRGIPLPAFVMNCRSLGAVVLGEGRHGYTSGQLPGPLFWPLFVYLQGTDARGAVVASHDGPWCRTRAGMWRARWRDKRRMGGSSSSAWDEAGMDSSLEKKFLACWWTHNEHVA